MTTPQEILKNTTYVDLVQLKCWPSAEDRLREGASPRNVALFIQRTGEMTHIKADSLARRLYRYKSRVLKPKQALNATYIDHMIANLDMTFNEVDELGKLILVQKKRIAKDLELEEHMPKMAPWLNKEITTLFDMLERRARLMQTLGILHREPERHMVAVFGDDTWAKILNAAEPPQRGQLRAAIQGEYAKIRDQEYLEEQQGRGFVPPSPEDEDIMDEW